MPQSSLIERIQVIFQSLKSHEIIDLLNQWNIDKLKLLSITIESKLGYDQLIGDVECKKFIDDIEESSVYSVAEYTQLIMFISTMGELNSRFNNDSAILNKYLVFHKMLYKTGSLVLKLLSDVTPVSNKQNTFIATNPIVSNPIANQVSQQNLINETIPSKVVTIDFSKIAADQQTLKTQQEHERLLQSKADEISRLEQELKSFRLPPHLQNIPAPTVQNNPVQSLQPQIEIEAKPVKVILEHKGIEDDMSLNNFLKSLALIDVPLESLQ